jgi:hypothetical protein
MSQVYTEEPTRGWQWPGSWLMAHRSSRLCHSEPLAAGEAGESERGTFGSGAVRLLHDDCHPERSRFSGVAKDLPLSRRDAKAKLHHYRNLVRQRGHLAHPAGPLRSRPSPRRPHQAQAPAIRVDRRIEVSQLQYPITNCHPDRSFPFPQGNGKRSGGTCCSRPAIFLEVSSASLRSRFAVANGPAPHATESG